MKPQFALNPAYVEYECALRHLHDLVASGQNDTADVDDIHDRMDELEGALDSTEIARLNGLSSDLYMLSGQEILGAPLANYREAAPAITEAQSRNDWERILGMLRASGGPLSQDNVAYVRARAYEELGHQETSLKFMEYAARLVPSKELYAFFVVDRLIRLNRSAAAIEYADERIKSGATSASFRILYGAALFASTKGENDSGVVPRLEEAVEVLNVALLGAPTDDDMQIKAYGYLVLGSCYEVLARVEEALKAYTAALHIAPDDVYALTLRGALYVGTNVLAAESDFGRAVQLNSPELTPYLHLAWSALGHHQFVTCVDLCRRIQSTTKDPGTLAAVLQWKAISQYTMGEPIHRVLHTAQQASDFDPLNPLLQETAERFREIEQSRPEKLLGSSSFRPVDVRTLKESHPRLPERVPALVAA